MRNLILALFCTVGLAGCCDGPMYPDMGTPDMTMLLPCPSGVDDPANPRSCSPAGAMCNFAESASIDVTCTCACGVWQCGQVNTVCNPDGGG